MKRKLSNLKEFLFWRFCLRIRTGPVYGIRDYFDFRIFATRAIGISFRIYGYGFSLSFMIK